jgi:hypothetical protein
LSQSGGGIELINGSYNVGAKNLSNDYTICGSDLGSLSVIQPSPQIQDYYWTISSGCSVTLQKVLVRHSWNASFWYDYNDPVYAHALFYPIGNSVLTLDTVTVNTISSSLLSLCIVFLGLSGDAAINIINSTFHDIGFTNVTLIYVYVRTEITVTNSTFKNIISL